MLTWSDVSLLAHISMSASLPVTQVDAVSASGLNVKHAYGAVVIYYQLLSAVDVATLLLPIVALISLWVYDYTLCLPDAVTLIVESRLGIGTLLYLACSHLPFVFMILNMLVIFRPDSPLYLCRSYDIANTNVGILTVVCAESIFILRAYAVWERERWIAVCAVISTIAYLVPGIIYLQEFNSSLSDPCFIPGVTGYVDMETRYRLCVAFGLLAVAELQILLFLLYRTVKSHGGWRIDNRIMLSLLRHNLLYFGCSFGWCPQINRYLTYLLVKCCSL
ncbi:hypothetical protein DEU56DRAFT_294172 [Suillus clintonianus]|uniref:uncharacterized protein n=1 Tax=Suillus clintonianus TaxID=1904413 RepID=UPI001B8664E7|nr:uncharacterized protein DEU56DRAFT_294172 [Suillus clintonianus]KAG2140127.1 hypothetical protein DEU56DRAFT_294172 [Suillus clintonianus]